MSGSTTTDAGWGGARRGAGRKGLAISRRVSAKLVDRHADWLDILKEREGLSNDTEAVRWLLDRDRELALRRRKRSAV